MAPKAGMMVYWAAHPNSIWARNSKQETHKQGTYIFENIKFANKIDGSFPHRTSIIIGSIIGNISMINYWISQTHNRMVQKSKNQLKHIPFSKISLQNQNLNKILQHEKTLTERGLCMNKATKSLSSKVRPIANMINPSDKLYEPGPVFANQAKVEGFRQATTPPTVT